MRGSKTWQQGVWLLNFWPVALCTLISEIAPGPVSTAVHVGMHHLHAYNTCVARRQTELNTVDYSSRHTTVEAMETQINADSLDKLSLKLHQLYLQTYMCVCCSCILYTVTVTVTLPAAGAAPPFPAEALAISVVFAGL